MAETKPLTTADAGAKAGQLKDAEAAVKAGEKTPNEARIDAGKAPLTAKPVPSQAKADDIREEVAGEDQPAKAKKARATTDDPYPSQADLDAIKEGTFKRRDRQVNAAGDGVEYKTR